MRILMVILIAFALVLAVWGVGMLWSAWKEPGAGRKLGWGLLGAGVFIAATTWAINLWGILGTF